MTCIVGVVSKGTVHIGGDACVTSPNGICYSMAQPKVFQKGEALIGMCGSYKVIDLLMYHMPPLSDTIDNFDSYLRTDFMPNVFNTLRKWTWTTEEEYSFEFLLGFKGKLYCFSDDFSIVDMPSYGYAIGSGGEVALGSLITTAKMALSPKDRIEFALKAAETAVPTVRGPFKIEQMPRPFDPLEVPAPRRRKATAK